MQKLSPIGVFAAIHLVACPIDPVQQAVPRIKLRIPPVRDVKTYVDDVYVR